jgi:DNA mismatch repair ATPase MutS
LTVPKNVRDACYEKFKNVPNFELPEIVGVLSHTKSFYTKENSESISIPLLSYEFSLEYGNDKSLVFYQVGSFYEAYQLDSQGYNLDILSDVMNCAVSKKDGVKMLGFPLQSLNKYLNILVDAGYQVKVIEQNAIGKIHGKINPINNGKIERTTKGIYSRGTMIDLDMVR